MNKYFVFGCWVFFLAFFIGASLLTVGSAAYIAIAGASPALWVRQAGLVALILFSLEEGIRATY